MPHGHSLALGLYVISWAIVGKLAFDIIGAAFSHSTPARALPQAL